MFYTHATSGGLEHPTFWIFSVKWAKANGEAQTCSRINLLPLSLKPEVGNRNEVSRNFYFCQDLVWIYFTHFLCRIVRDLFHWIFNIAKGGHFRMGVQSLRECSNNLYNFVHPGFCFMLVHITFAQFLLQRRWSNFSPTLAFAGTWQEEMSYATTIWRKVWKFERWRPIFLPWTKKTSKQMLSRRNEVQWKFCFNAFT